MTEFNIDFDKLFETAEQIMVLRGGPTSGNWAHSGRKGKRGGSGRGGGFKRIGVKGGKKTGRKKIKQSSRRTRTKDERTKGGGAPAGSGDIPSGVVARAKSDVAKAKKVRDKDFRVAVKASKAAAKAHAATDKAVVTFRKASDKFDLEDQKRLSIRKKLGKKREQLSSFRENNDIFAPHVIDKSKKLEGQIVKLNERLHSQETRTNKAMAASIAANAEFTSSQLEIEKLKGTSSLKDVMKAYQDKTKQASDILFADNLNKGKAARTELISSEKNRILEIERLTTEKSKQEKVIDSTFEKMQKSNLPENDPRSFKMIDESLQESTKLGVINRRLLELKSGPEMREKLYVDNPTKITQAPGSQKDGIPSIFPKASRQRRREKGIDAFQNMVSDDVLPKGSLVKYMNTDNRSFQMNTVISEVYMDKYSGADIVVHELGHMAENYNPRLLRRSKSFLENRTKGESEQRLSDLPGGSGFYNDDEVTRPDKFINPYIGKSYKDSSEISSMGLQMMFSDPLDFAKKDPDMFDFIYAQMRTP